MKKWLCYHIHYQDDFNPILVNVIAELVDVLSKDNLIDGYFFLRYWKNGPHLRFRMLSNSSNEKTVCPIANKKFEDFLANSPSQTLVAEGNDQYSAVTEQFATLEQEERDKKFIDNNTFHIADYLPEYDKYGGHLGVEISEYVFCKSSSIILNDITHSKYNKSGLYLRAIEYFCCALKAFDISQENRVVFSKAYFKYWSKYLNLFFGEKASEKLPTLYLSNQATLHAMFKKMGSHETMHDSHLNNWYNTLQCAYNKIVSNKQLLQREIQSPEAKSRVVEYLLTQYIHTHNNRLGISAPEEAIVAFLAYSTLDDMMKSVQHA